MRKGKSEFLFRLATAIPNTNIKNFFLLIKLFLKHFEMQTQNPQTIFHLSGNERLKFWNNFLGLYQTPNLDLISDEKKKVILKKH